MTRVTQRVDGQNANDVGRLFTTNPFSALTDGPNDILPPSEPAQESGPDGSTSGVGLSREESSDPDEADVNTGQTLGQMDHDLVMDQQDDFMMNDAVGAEDDLGELHPTESQMG